MKNYQPIILSLILCLIVFGMIFPASHAQAAKGITDRMLDAVKKFDLPQSESNPETTAIQIVGRVINAFLSIFGIIFFALMVFGGYKWMMASGREEEITKAKDTIRSAIIGLIIVMMAFAITYFISQALTAATTA